MRALEHRAEARLASNAPKFPQLGTSTGCSESNQSSASAAAQRDLIALEQELQTLREKVKGLKDSIARHSI